MADFEDFEDQIARIADKAELRKMLDALGDDDIALVITRMKDPDQTLAVTSYGTARQAEWAGLVAYAQAMMYRTYWREDA